MDLTIANIIALFYFGYWIVYNSQPFSIWLLVVMYAGLYILHILLTSIIKGSANKIEKEGKDIKKTIEGFENRLRKLEMRENVK